MADRGKLVVSAILAVALALAGFAWYWNYAHGRRSLDFWGREQALLIRQAPDVELMRLVPLMGENNSNEKIVFAGKSWAVIERKNISKAQGLLHARFALTVDASFHFDEPADPASAQWDVAARFSRDGQAATVLFDFQHEQLGIAEHGRVARVVPKIVSGWRQFVGRHLVGEDSLGDRQ